MFAYQNFVFPLCPVLVTCPAHLILIYLIIFIIFGEGRKFGSSSLLPSSC